MNPSSRPRQQFDGNRLSDRLLSWYDAHGRSLPWRAKPGEPPDPYGVWLSEIMLQQTTVVTVGPYYMNFIGRWPTIGALARADLDEVLTVWAGLGYYSRARNLHACARYVAEHYNGRFPSDEAALKSLPGIGPYTAAAVAAIAFERPANVVDGNVERVMARLFHVETPLPQSKRQLRDLAGSVLPAARFGDYAQALMDLGATICVPRLPKCQLCPIAAYCQARAQNAAADLPRRIPRKKKPLRKGIAFWGQNRDGAVLLRRRPATGLLGGMLEVPSSPWLEVQASPDELMVHAPFKASWRRQDGIVRHSFTHFHLELEVYTALLVKRSAVRADFQWAAIDQLETLALPTLMKKVARHARNALAV